MTDRSVITVSIAKSPVEEKSVMFQLSEKFSDVDRLSSRHGDQHDGNQQVPDEEENRKYHLGNMKSHSCNERESVETWLIQ